MPWMIVVILLTLLDTLSSEVACIRLADIYWNVTNPIFRIDNTDHIIDVNKGNVPFEYDQVNIICPVYPHHGTTHNEDEEEEEDDDDEERYIIYNVSKEEYDSCRITNPNPRIIAVCDRPHQLMYFTITFRSFTPQPGGLEFLPGHDYYFVSTSTGDFKGLHQRVGGRCATHHMKVIFKVCCTPGKGTTSSGSGWSQPTLANSSSPGTSSVESSSTRPVASDKNFDLHQRHFPSRVPGNNHWGAADSSSTISPIFNFGTRPTRPLKPSYEMPIEDEMAKVPSADNEINADEREQFRNKARAKNEELVNGVSNTNLVFYRNWTLASSLVLQLLLTFFWR